MTSLPAPLPIIHPGCRVQVIDESYDPPRWRTLAKCPDTPRHINAVIELHGLKSAWVQDCLGQRRRELRRKMPPIKPQTISQILGPRIAELYAKKGGAA